MVNVSYIIECSGFTHLKGARTVRALHFPSQYRDSQPEPGSPHFPSPPSLPYSCYCQWHLTCDAATRESLTHHLLPEPASTLSHLLACRWINFKGRKYFLLDAMKQLPCLPAPGKCPNVSGNKQQLHQTARVFSVYSRGCHLPWLLQCGPQWFYRMTKGREIGIKKLTDFDSSTVGGEIQVTVSQAVASTAQYRHPIWLFPAHMNGWRALYKFSEF